MDQEKLSYGSVMWTRAVRFKRQCETDTFTKGIPLTEVPINQIKTTQSSGILKVVPQNKQVSAKFQRKGIYSLI